MTAMLTTVRVYFNHQGYGVIRCVFCGATWSMTLATHQGYPGGTVFSIRCGACHHIFNVLAECRRHQRLHVALPGTLYAPNAPEALDTITVTSLSAGGIGFRMTQHTPILGAQYVVVFVLQDDDQSVIREDIIIRRVEGTTVGAEFAAPTTPQWPPDRTIVPDLAAFSQGA